MEDEVVLHIREDKSILVEIREEGVVRTKVIDIDALLDCLTDLQDIFKAELAAPEA